MIETLFSLFPSGGVAAILAAVIAALAAAFKLFSAGKSAGRNEQKVKEKDSYEKHLSNVRKAADAANSVRTGVLHPDEKDRYRRD